MKKILLGLLILLGIGANAQALENNKNYKAFIDTDKMGYIKIFKVDTNGEVTEYDQIYNRRAINRNETTTHDGNVTKYSYQRGSGNYKVTETYVFTNDPITHMIFVDVIHNVKDKGKKYEVKYGEGCVDVALEPTFGPHEENK